MSGARHRAWPEGTVEGAICRTFFAGGRGPRGRGRDMTNFVPQKTIAQASSSKKRKTKNAKAAKKTIASDADMITPAICWSASGESPQSRGASS
jgi:hypothetical protein